METKFQTSFIPKKPLISPTMSMQSKPRRSVSLFMMFAVIIFVASLGAVGGTYLWKQYLISSQDNYRTQLAEREKQFNTDLIEQLKRVNVQIDMAKQLLNNHLAISGIFDIISHFTAENSRFMSLDVTAPTNSSDGIKISMRGFGKDFQSVAFQSDILGQLEQYGLRKIVKNPILSDPSLDGGAGTVSFGFTATLDPTSLSYKQSVLGSLDTTGQGTGGQASSTGQ